MPERHKQKLGVNIDHVATLRQARGGAVPDPARAAREAQSGGADQITLHLREDRRHIQDRDVPAVKRAVRVPVNLEMALAEGIIRFALRARPRKVCIVPEKRQELTTEGGLDAVGSQDMLRRVLPRFRRKKIGVSLFIDPEPEQILCAWGVGADAVELHTGTYANRSGGAQKRELARIRRGARLAAKLGLQVHAGHGLDLKNVKAIARIPEIRELNIGHSIIGRSVFVGLKAAVKEMKRAMRRQG